MENSTKTGGRQIIEKNRPFKRTFSVWRAAAVILASALILVACKASDDSSDSAPTISSVSPSDGATDVSIDTTITATFNEDMDDTTITTSTFTVSDGTNHVNGTVSYTAGTATFTPDNHLDEGGNYTATITTDVKNQSGDALDSDYTWSFETDEDLSPKVTEVSPGNDAIDVAGNSSISATFDKDLDATTLTTDTFTLSDGTNAVSGTVSYSDRVATFSAETYFDGTTTYTATLTTNIKDSGGEAMSENYSWSFKTDKVPVLPDSGDDIALTVVGEDSEYQIHPLSFTDNGDTITDNNTLLMWPKAIDNISKNWSAAQTHCADLTTDDYTDWRIPTIKEFQSIFELDQVFPVVDNTTYFTGITGTGPDFWTSTIYPGNSGRSIIVSSGRGNSSDVSTDLLAERVYCVRDTSTLSVWSADFFDNGNGTVLHRPTGLIWQQEDDNIVRDWEGALSYCEDLSLGGQSDWRLPNFKELVVLVDHSKNNPAIDSTLFPNTNSSGMNDVYWTSTSRAGDSTKAWYVWFNDGRDSALGEKVGDPRNTYTRCVRSGE